MRRRSNADHLPERFDEALAAVMEFADPILSIADAETWGPSSSHDVRQCDKRGESHRTAERGEDQERSYWHMQSAAQDCYYIKRRHTGDATRGDCCKLYWSRTEKTSPSSFDTSFVSRWNRSSGVPARVVKQCLSNHMASDRKQD